MMWNLVMSWLDESGLVMVIIKGSEGAGISIKKKIWLPAQLLDLEGRIPADEPRGK